MLKYAFLPAFMAMAATAYAQSQPPQTLIKGRSDLRSIYEISEIGAQRTQLTRENKYPGLKNVEVGMFFNHAERTDVERDSVGVEGRYGLWDTVTLGAGLPYVLDSELFGESENGIGDVRLSLDLLAYQDIFTYPFVIPHVDVFLPTGDEDKGLGAGETVINLGLSVGTKTHDVLTWVLDFTYSFNGANYFFSADDNIYLVSASVIWDVSDRLAFLVEGRIYEELDDMDSMPYEVQGGIAYLLTRDLQLTINGGILNAGFDDDYNQVNVKLTRQF